MRVLKSYLLALLISSSAISLAQAPGYLGKKFSVGYNFNFFPYMNFLVWGDHPDFITWANKNEFSASVALGRKCSFSVSYAICNQEYLFEEGEVSVYDPSFGGYYYTSTFNPNPSMVPVKADFVDLRLKIFGKNFIAPIGFYYQFKYGFFNYSLKDLSGKVKGYYYSNGGNIYTDVKQDKPEYTGNRFSFGIGSTKSIGGGRMYFDAQVSYTLLYFGGDIEKMNTSNSNNSSYSSNLNYYVKENLNKGFRAYNRMEIVLGLGVLIF